MKQADNEIEKPRNTLKQVEITAKKNRKNRN